MNRDPLENRACRENHSPPEKDHCRELDGHTGKSISETDGICQSRFPALLWKGRRKSIFTVGEVGQDSMKKDERHVSLGPYLLIFPRVPFIMAYQ